MVQQTAYFNPDNYESPDVVGFYLSQKYPAFEKRVLEPTAGTGQLAKFYNKPDTICFEIDHDRMIKGREVADQCTWYNQDFLKAQFYTDERYDLIIANPPYGDDPNRHDRTLPIAFIDKCLDLVTPIGDVIFLLESDYFKSKRRYPLLTEKGIYLDSVTDLVGRLRFLKNGVPSESQTTRYHSIYSFTRTKRAFTLHNYIQLKELEKMMLGAKNEQP